MNTNLKEKLNILNSQIAKKEEELRPLTTTFSYNPRVAELAREMTDLKVEREAIMKELKEGGSNE